MIFTSTQISYPRSNFYIGTTIVLNFAIYMPLWVINSSFDDLFFFRRSTCPIFVPQSQCCVLYRIPKSIFLNKFVIPYLFK